MEGSVWDGGEPPLIPCPARRGDPVLTPHPVGEKAQRTGEREINSPQEPGGCDPAATRTRCTPATPPALSRAPATRVPSQGKILTRFPKKSGCWHHTAWVPAVGWTWGAGTQRFGVQHGKSKDPEHRGPCMWGFF